MLLSVPNYDFNWQTTYELTTPKLLPAGTKVTHSTTCDNSSQNKANPDPNREVPWGQQTWDEMLYGVVRFRYDDDGGADRDCLAHARIVLRALVSPDQQALRDHVPADLVEQLGAPRPRLEARHRVEGEHLERVAMCAVPRLRIGRGPSSR